MLRCQNTQITVADCFQLLPYLPTSSAALLHLHSCLATIVASPCTCFHDPSSGWPFSFQLQSLFDCNPTIMIHLNPQTIYPNFSAQTFHPPYIASVSYTTPYRTEATTQPQPYLTPG